MTKPSVMLTLPVLPGPTSADGPGAGYVRMMTTGYLPGEGDEIQLWPGGPLWPVRRRHWKANGVPLVELHGAVLDPTCVVLHTEMPWDSALSGDLAEQLLANGWEPVAGPQPGDVLTVTHVGRAADGTPVAYAAP